MTPRRKIAYYADVKGDGRCACVCVCVLTETPLLNCADELKPWPAVSEGISPLNDTKLQGSTSAQHIHCCLCCFNWIAAIIRLYILLKLRKMNIRIYINSYNRGNNMLQFLSTISRYLKMYQIVLLYQNLSNIKVLITKSLNLEINYFHTAQKITQKHDSNGTEAFSG